MDAMKGRYMTTKAIADLFDCHATYISTIRAFIRRHPERYSYYAIQGNLTNVFAFMDARVFKQAIERGHDVPPFDIDAAARMLYGEGVK